MDRSQGVKRVVRKRQVRESGVGNAKEERSNNKEQANTRASEQTSKSTRDGVLTRVGGLLVWCLLFGCALTWFSYMFLAVC